MAKSLHVVVNERGPNPIHWVDRDSSGGQRFCRVCQRHVVALSSLSADQIATVFDQGGCVSFEYQADGSLVMS